jgi:hypothetical protein
MADLVIGVDTHPDTITLLRVMCEGRRSSRFRCPPRPPDMSPVGSRPWEIESFQALSAAACAQHRSA